MTEHELIVHCVNPDAKYRVSSEELAWFHNLIRTRPDFNGIYDNPGFLDLEPRQRRMVLNTLHYGPFQDLDNLNATGSATFGHNRRDAPAFHIVGGDRQDVRPRLSHRPYQAFPRFVIEFSLL